MDKPAFYARFLRPRIEEALTDSPVVLIHGPRQCGKTTLARLVGDDARFAYFSFDDDLQRAAWQSACLVNVSKLAGPFQISRQTICEYLTLLSRVFLVDELPAWYSNRMKRLVKTPKLQLGDTGLACALLGLDEESLFLRHFQGGKQDLKEVIQHSQQRPQSQVFALLRRGRRD